MPATVTYQWEQRAAGSSDPFTDIDGADASSYTVGAGSPSMEYRLHLVARRDGHETQSGYYSNVIVIEATP